MMDGTRRGLAGGLIFLLGPILPAAAQPEPRGFIRERLAFARDMLCVRCDNDIEAEGVNRPMRRVMLAGSALEEADRAIEAAITRGEVAYRAARLSLRQAREALGSLDERTAVRAIGRAIRAVGEATPGH